MQKNTNQEKNSDYVGKDHVPCKKKKKKINYEHGLASKFLLTVARGRKESEN